MRTILVSGGAGYIGAHAVRGLTAHGYPVVVLDNFSTGHREFVENVPYVEGDVGDMALVERIVNEYQISAAMHFASYINVGDSVNEPGLYYRNNLAAGINFITALQATGVKQFIFSSTCAVYGGIDALRPLCEDDVINPLNPYAQAKRMMEIVLADFAEAHDFHAVIFRYFNAAGASEDCLTGEWHEPETHLIPNILRSAFAVDSAPLKIFGNDYPIPGRDGTCVRDYIHVSDLADAHIKGLDFLRKESGVHAFNLGTGRGASVLEVVEAAEKVIGAKVRYSIAARRAGDAAYLVADSAKAQKILGWKPAKSDLETIIKTAYAWEKKLATIKNRH